MDRPRIHPQAPLERAPGVHVGAVERWDGAYSSCDRLTVATASPAVAAEGGPVEQRLYEWCCDTAHKAATKRQALEVMTCFMPLLYWIVVWGNGTQLFLALDAMSLVLALWC